MSIATPTSGRGEILRTLKLRKAQILEPVGGSRVNKGYLKQTSRTSTIRAQRQTEAMGPPLSSTGGYRAYLDAAQGVPRRQNHLTQMILEWHKIGWITITS